MHIDQYTVDARLMRLYMQHLHSLPGATRLKIWFHMYNIHPGFYIPGIVSANSTFSWDALDEVYLDAMTDFIDLCAHTDVQLDYKEIHLLLGRQWHMFYGILSVLLPIRTCMSCNYLRLLTTRCAARYLLFRNSGRPESSLLECQSLPPSLLYYASRILTAVEHEVVFWKSVLEWEYAAMFLAYRWHETA